MAFITLEDLTGSVEIIVFPRKYEEYQKYLQEDARLFVEGRAAAEENKDSRVICEKIWSFDEVPRDIWIQFETKEDFTQKEALLRKLIHDSDGKDEIVIYLRQPKAVRRMGPALSIDANETLLEELKQHFGAENVKLTARVSKRQGGNR